MFWINKPRFILIPSHMSAFVRQIDRDPDIKHLGAVVSINIIKKEDTLMVEKLRAYRAELEDKKATIVNADFTQEIEKDVCAYRESLIKTSEENRAKNIAKVDSDIECIDTLIAREETLAESGVTEATITC